MAEKPFIPEPYPRAPLPVYLLSMIPLPPEPSFESLNPSPGAQLPALLGMDLEGFATVAKAACLLPFAAKQLAKWVYEKRVFDPALMTDLPKRSRELLADLIVSGTAAPLKVSESSDGTKKYLFKTASGHFIEAAYIPDPGRDGRADRATLCVSSQVGCKMGCLFCSTGKMGFHGQLSTTEILNQIVSIPESASLTNLVFMGMGEPMDNLDEVLGALKVITSPWGFAMSPRRVTVSTVGVLPGLRRFLVESECHLALSLHFPFAAERQPFMPVERAYALPELIATLRAHDFGGQRRLSFEYILFEGLNDAPRHVAELTRLLRGLDCRVNLIAFHAIPDVPFVPASRERLEWFRDELERRGFTATIRASRGLDIQAACGLLSTRELEGL